MALTVPVLDDKRYEEIRRSLVAGIPLVEKRWSDHNASDPGIALLELIASMAEVLSYRLDQIPDAVYDNFLKMVVDPPEPVTTRVRFTRELPSADLAVLPAGAVFPPEMGNRIEYLPAQGRLVFRGAMTAAERALLEGLSADAAYLAAIAELAAASNRTLVVSAGTRVGGAATPELYETVSEARIQPGVLSVDVDARHLEAMPFKALGASDGKPAQSFALMDDVAPGQDVRPVLLDPERQGSDIYDPNPEVTVDGDRWRYREDLLEAGPSDRFFTVEPLTYKVFFGDGVRGAVPPAGAPIAATQHQVIRGAEVQVPAGALTHLAQTRIRLTSLPAAAAGLVPGVRFDPRLGHLIADGPITRADRDALLALDPDPAYQESVRALHEAAALAVVNLSDALGGRFRFTMRTAGTDGLEAIRETERAVTAEDFRYLATEALAEISALGGPGVRRCHAHRLDDLGTVAIILVPEPAGSDDRWPIPSIELKERVYELLDRRRLITTRLLVGDPRYRDVAVEIEVAAGSQADASTLREEVSEALNERFSPLTGGEDGSGWPLGRGIYRSEIFELVSGLDGVDHVPSVLLDDGEADVLLAPLELPRIDVAISGVTIVTGGTP